MQENVRCLKDLLAFRSFSICKRTSDGSKTNHAGINNLGALVTVFTGFITIALRNHW